MSRTGMAKSFRPSRRAVLGSGQPISQLMAQALAKPELISLAAGFVDQETLPVEATRETFGELFADAAVARRCLQYGTTLGDPELRELLLARTFGSAETAGIRPDVEQVVVTSGSNQLLHLVAESLLDPGDIVLCASPTYLVFLGTLANLGARSVGVKSDELGMIPDGLEEQLQTLQRMGESDRVKAIYLVNYFDNPRGITMPAERISQVIAIAQRWSHTHRIHVIADEAYRELRYQGDDEASALLLDEEGETVIVAGTFSKSFSPGIRVGWGILPRHLVKPVCDQKGNIDFGSPNLNQQLMRRVLERGIFELHVDRIRNQYTEKLSAMLDAAEEFLGPLEGVRWTRPDGGLYIWAELPEEIDTGPDGELFQKSVDQGVLYVPGQYAFAAEGSPVQRNTMRLSFGVQTCQRIHDGMAALSRAVGSL
jgi:2-aminoadipate transaminase